MMASPFRGVVLLMSATIFIGSISKAFSAKLFEDLAQASIPSPIYSIDDLKSSTSLKNDFRNTVVRIRRQTLGGGCIMPQSSANGTYSLRGTVKVKGGELAPYNSILQLTCPLGYLPSNNGVNYCDDDKNDWFEELSICQKSCKSLKSATVEFTCTIPSKNGKPMRGSCETTLPSGATAAPKCRSGHHSITNSRSVFCIDGRWGYSMPSCKPECGKTTPHGTVNVINGTNAVKGEFPWHVAIYSTYGHKVMNSVPTYWCGGSIVSTSLVISAAHCFYDAHAKQPFDVNLFTAAVGKVYSAFVHSEETMDPFIQKSGVKRIEIPPDYDGELSSYSHDLAILILQTPLTFSNLIMPVCLNLVDKNFDEDQCSPGLEATVVGFGLVEVNGEASDVLKTAVMPIISKNQCKSDSPPQFTKYIVWDKLCAGYTTGIGVCKGDSGGGLVVSSIERDTLTWFLRGIVSTAPASENNDKCSTNTYSTFTRPFMHKEFIDDIIYKEGCTMPNNPPNGKFVLIGLRNAAPGEGVGHKSQITLRCDDGFASSDFENNICDEFTGDWVKDFPICEVIPVTQSTVLNTRHKIIEGCVIPNHPPNGRFTALTMEKMMPGDIVPPKSSISLKCLSGYSSTSEINVCDANTNNWMSDLGTCLKMCDSIQSLTVKFNCSNPLSKEDQVIGCDVPVPSGSLATPTCEVGHYSNERLLTLVCKDGSWDQTIPKCTAICGRPIYHSHIVKYDGNDKYAKKGEFPWHTAIYKLDNKGKFQYRCGGNILSRLHIIGNGFCYSSRTSKVSASELLVAVGKMFSELDHIEEMQETYIQKIRVKKIETSIVLGEMDEEITNDLGILILETPITFSEYVMPICLDLQDIKAIKMPSKAHILARAAGFGFETRRGPLAPQLKALTLPIIPISKCRQIIHKDVLKYLSPDKACAGVYGVSDPPTPLCVGDGGSGLAMSNVENGTTVWYLRGVVTLFPWVQGRVCDTDSFSVFTRPLHHKYFIQSVLNGLDLD